VWITLVFAALSFGNLWVSLWMKCGWFHSSVDNLRRFLNCPHFLQVIHTFIHRLSTDCPQVLNRPKREYRGNRSLCRVTKSEINFETTMISWPKSVLSHADLGNLYVVKAIELFLSREIQKDRPSIQQSAARWTRSNRMRHQRASRFIAPLETYLRG